jgi:hypothetical protein
MPPILPVIGGLRDRENVHYPLSGRIFRAIRYAENGSRANHQTPEPEGAFAPQTEPEQIRDHDSE